jgi:hypothetical protein
MHPAIENRVLRATSEITGSARKPPGEVVRIQNPEWNWYMVQGTRMRIIFLSCFPYTLYLEPYTISLGVAQS